MTDKEETTPSTTASTNDGLKQSIETQQQEQNEQQPVSQTAQQEQGGEQQSGQAQQQEQSGEQQSSQAQQQEQEQEQGGKQQSGQAQQQEQGGEQQSSQAQQQEQGGEQQSGQAQQQGQSGEQQSSQAQQGGEQQSDEPELLDEMTFWDHLEALRWMLVRVFSALGIFIIGGFAFIPWIFEHVIMAPIDNQFFLYRWLAKMSEQVAIMPDDLTRPFHVSIINIRLSSQFFLHMSLSFWLALLITFPYLVYEVWKFICPALYENERKSMRFTFVFGTVMFFIGCVVGYSVVFPLTLRFLYNYQLSASISNQLSLDSYMDNFLMLVFMMGIVFELPLVSMLLGKIGILHRGFFSTYRSHAVVALLVVAAFITPSSDPFTLMAVFIPIYILWELSAFLVKPAPKDD